MEAVDAIKGAASRYNIFLRIRDCWIGGTLEGNRLLEKGEGGGSASLIPYLLFLSLLHVFNIPIEQQLFQPSAYQVVSNKPHKKCRLLRMRPPLKTLKNITSRTCGHLIQFF